MTPLVELCFFPLIAQAIFYGLYFTTFVHGVRWLIFDDEGWRLREKINSSMLAVSTIIFLLLTANLGITFSILKAAADSRVMTTLQRTVISSTVDILISLIIDAVLIYRCWIVHTKSWCIICLPLILWLSFLSSSIVSMYYFSIILHSKDLQSAILASIQEYRFSIVIYATNIATNIYATSAIIYRIFRIAARNRNSAHIHNIGRILAESGILYTITSTIALVATALNVQYKFELNLFHYVAAIVNVSMAGIAFNLILIRVGHSKATSQQDTQNSSQDLTKNQEVISTFVFHVTTDDTTTTTIQDWHDSQANTISREGRDKRMTVGSLMVELRGR